MPRSSPLSQEVQQAGLEDSAADGERLEVRRAAIARYSYRPVGPSWLITSSSIEPIVVSTRVNAWKICRNRIRPPIALSSDIPAMLLRVTSICPRRFDGLARFDVLY